MEIESENLNFEKAAEIRDEIEALRRIWDVKPIFPCLLCKLTYSFYKNFRNF